MYAIWYLIASVCDCLKWANYLPKPDWAILLRIESQYPISSLLQNANS